MQSNKDFLTSHDQQDFFILLNSLISSFHQLILMMHIPRILGLLVKLASEPEFISIFSPKQAYIAYVIWMKPGVINWNSKQFRLHVIKFYFSLNWEWRSKTQPNNMSHDRRNNITDDGQDTPWPLIFKIRKVIPLCTLILSIKI